MFQTGIKQPFTARHALRGDFGEESRPHSHRYVVELICATTNLDGNGFSTDIALMKRVLRDLLSSIDNRMLNEMPYFAERQPSLENLACFLHESARERLPVTGLLTVKIWESEDAWAQYEA